MDTEQRILKFSGYKGKHFSFFYNNDLPEIIGWWNHEDGSEGGTLIYCAESNEIDEIDNFDGDIDLPDCVIEELNALGIATDW